MNVILDRNVTFDINSIGLYIMGKILGIRTGSYFYAYFKELLRLG